MNKPVKHPNEREIEWDYKTITKPGLYKGIPLDLYHSHKLCDAPSVSSSGLRRIFSESPAHFYATWSGNPKRIEPDDKPHFVLGRALHHLVLGEPFFAKLFAVEPAQYVDEKTGEAKAWNNSARVCRAWHEQMQKAGRAVLRRKDVDSLRGMAEAIGRHPFAHQALKGKIERSLIVKDADTGIWIKSRPDSIPNDSGDYVDLKKTTSVKWEKLRRTIFEFGYHQQLALVRSNARSLGIPFHSATLIFVEDRPPFCPRVVSIKDGDLDRGEHQNRAALDAMARCLKSGHWPGPGGEREDAEHIELEEWAQNKIDDRIKFGIAT